MRIKQLRENKGITQEDIAKKLNIKQSTYSNKEAGKRSFTVEELLKLELILGVSISDMYKELKRKVEGDLSKW